MLRSFLACLAFCSPLLAADATPGPLPAETAAKQMVLPDGFKATVFAAEPQVVQPVSFCIDSRGRLIVAEALNYGEWKPTGKDRIVVLEDTDGDGKADKRTVLYEGFNYITGVEYGFGGLWVMSTPCLYFVPMDEGADKVKGEPEVVFDGFGYKESRHNLVNGFTWGPDGWLYGGHGRTSPSDVGKPGTPKEQRIHCDGGVYRIHPTRRVFENFADGTTNPWGVDFDDYGQCFVSNCVNPHLFHMIQGGHYEPWRNRPSSQYAYQRLPTIADHLHYPGGDIRGVLGKDDTLAMGGGHAHCGTLVYLGDSFPKEYRNTVFMCNVHGRRINNDILKRKGSGYTASHGKDFMISADPWFMGVTLRTGPDGSIFVSDWSDTGECHTYKPHTENGRIYKISYGEGKKPLDLLKMSDAELVKLQLHPNDFYVRHARRMLQERAAVKGWEGKETHESLREMLKASLTEPQQLRAMWALWVTNGLGDADLLQLRRQSSPEYVRAWAVQLLCEKGTLDKTISTMLSATALLDRSNAVRLALASALQRLPLKDRWAIAEVLSTRPDVASDQNIPLMIWYGLEPLVSLDPAKATQLASEAEIPLVREFIARRLVEHAVAQKEKGDLSPWVKALEAAASDIQADLLKGAVTGLEGRKSMPMPADWPKLYAKLRDSEDKATRENVTVLALIFGDPHALADLRKTALEKAGAAADRSAALQALIDKRVEELPLLALLDDPAVRRTALKGLAAIPNPDTAKRVLGIYANLTADEKQDAIATLASRKDYALALLDAVEKGTVPRGDVTAYAARQMNALEDKQVSDRLRTVWGEIRQSGPQKVEQLAKWKKALTPASLKSADVVNGRQVFIKTCAQCHKLYGEGGAIGPDITGSNRSDMDYLLSNLIDPSAEVSKDYRMSAVETASGRKITGIIVEKTAARVVIQTATERIVVPAEDVEKIKDSDISIMPEGQLDTLTKEQVRDLIGYLSAKTQTPLPKN